jgi:myo-inositol 2-dehydrogenase/D-chiro-inositol 1-dehydrogenase
MVIHDFDMGRRLPGEEPVEVMATASRLVDSRLVDLDDFDTIMVQMRSASGLRPTTVRRWGKTETEVREPLLNFFLERYAEGPTFAKLGKF